MKLPNPGSQPDDRFETSVFSVTMEIDISGSLLVSCSFPFAAIGSWKQETYESFCLPFPVWHSCSFFFHRESLPTPRSKLTTQIIFTAGRWNWECLQSTKTDERWLQMENCPVGTTPEIQTRVAEQLNCESNLTDSTWPFCELQTNRSCLVFSLQQRPVQGESLFTRQCLRRWSRILARETTQVFFMCTSLAKAASFLENLWSGFLCPPLDQRLTISFLPFIHSSQTPVASVKFCP